MKFSLLSLLLFWIVASCERTKLPSFEAQAEKQRQKVQSQGSPRGDTGLGTEGESQLVNNPSKLLSLTALRDKTTALVLSQNATGEIPTENLEVLMSLAPAMAEGAILTDVLTAIPNRQLPAFKEVILAYLKTMAPAPVMNLYPEYEDTVHLARKLNDPALANILIDHLPKLPTYYFPDEPEELRWRVMDARNIQHLQRGTQGLVARTIVSIGDEDVMIRYREQLKTAPPQRQRVMVWALGESPDLTDFELLWSLRDQVSDPGTADTLKRALNAIPVSMERLGKYGGQTNRTGITPVELEKLALDCRNRLKAADLLIPNKGSQ